MLEDTNGEPLLLQGGNWQASTNVQREAQHGHRWCWAACVAMVLGAFGNYKKQCKIAKAVCPIPCTLDDDVNDGCDLGYKVDDIETLWNKQHDVPARSHPGAVGWDVIEQELKPKEDEGKPSRPVEIFLGIGDADSKDGHLVLIVGAEMTADGRRTVSIADPVSTTIGLVPTDFDSLETDLDYGKWNKTWTNLFWEKKDLKWFFLNFLKSIAKN